MLQHHGRPRHRLSAATRCSRPTRPSGCSSRSPTSTRPRTCAATSRTASRRPRALLDRFNELAANYSDETADEFARLQAQIDAADAWNLDTNVEYAMDALRLPPADADVTHALRRRAPPRRALPAAARDARPAAPRRADEPPRRRVGRVARAAPRRVQGHRRRGHPRSLLPRQRRRLDPRARPRPRASPTRATTRAGSSRSRPAWRRRRAPRRRARRRSRPSSTGSARTPRAARRSRRRAWRTSRRSSPRSATSSSTRSRSTSRPRPRLGDVVVEAEGLRKGFGDKLLIDGLSFSLPRGGIVGVIGANGAGKTTLFRMITGSEQPDGGDAPRSARRSRCPTSTRAATPSTATRPSGRRSRAAWSRSRSARRG